MQRLQGVQALQLAPHLAAASSTETPVSMQAGACHSDRLRWGQFLRVDVGAFDASGTSSGGGGQRRRRGRPWRGSALSLLQGALLPSLFSYQPGLAFQVAAFDGGAAWLVAVEFLGLPPAEPEPGQQAPAAGSSSSRGSSSNSGGGGARGRRGGRAAAEQARTPESWQQAQAQRLAALQLMHAAAALPHQSLQAPGGVQAQPGQPVRCMLSSAQLPDAAHDPQLAAAALETVGLPAFRAALSLHLNGLAAAPADASPAHVRRTAAAQAAFLSREGRRPPLCTAQLQAAFGPAWLEELQVGAVGLWPLPLLSCSHAVAQCAGRLPACHACFACPPPCSLVPSHPQGTLLAGGMQGLAEGLAPPELAAQGSGEWLYLNPALLLGDV